LNLFRKTISETEVSLNALQSEHEALAVTFETAKNELVTMTELNATLQSEFARVDAENVALKAQIAELNADNVTLVESAVDVDVKATEKAIDLIADLGVAPVEITEDAPQKTILEQFQALKGAEAQAFYNANKAEIFKALKR
jgi:hypothetical protein